LELLEKVDYKLDFSANQIANRQIKYVAAMAGINDGVRRGNELSPKSNFVTFHTARRSAATNLYLSGVSTKLIADLGGYHQITEG
jgi:integrase